MIVRFSKYDFWIPEQILDFKKFVPEKNIFSWDEKYFSEKCRKICFRNFFEKSKITKKSLKINTKISGKIRKKIPPGFSPKILYWFSMKSFDFFYFSKTIQKIFFRHFSEKYFSSQEKIFFPGTNFLKSEIWSGIQKSYLENYTSIIKLFKIKNPVFLTQIPGFPYGVTYTDP